MRFSDAGLRLLKQFEGFRSRIYKDVAGLTTIGYGHRLRAGESFPDGIPEAQASALLACDVQAAELAVARLVTVLLTQGQFDALVDFVFNLGAGRLANSTLLARLNAGEFEAAGEELLRWDHAAGEENSGLKARRRAEFELWNSVEIQAQAA
jgi:lysozyme